MAYPRSLSGSVPPVPKYISFDIFNFRQNNSQKMLDVYRLTLSTVCSIRNCGFQIHLIKQGTKQFAKLFWQPLRNQTNRYHSASSNTKDLSKNNSPLKLEKINFKVQRYFRALHLTFNCFLIVNFKFVFDIWCC